MGQFDDDEDDKRRQPQAQGAAPAGAPPAASRQSAQRAQPSYPFQRTFQPQQEEGSAPGQQTPMPWSGLTPGFAPGRQATPWAQGIQPPQAAPGAAPADGGMGGGTNAPGMTPNWQALAQRFGGGAPGGIAPGAGFRLPMPGQGGGPQGGQGNPWLQGLMQRIGQQIAARRAMGGGGQQRQVPPQGAPVQPGFAQPRGGTPIIPGNYY